MDCRVAHTQLSHGQRREGRRRRGALLAAGILPRCRLPVAAPPSITFDVQVRAGDDDGPGLEVSGEQRQQLHVHGQPRQAREVGVAESRGVGEADIRYRQAQLRKHAQAHVAIDMQVKTGALFYKRDHLASVMHGVGQHRKHNGGDGYEHRRNTDEHGEQLETASHGRLRSCGFRSRTRWRGGRHRVPAQPDSVSR